MANWMLITEHLDKVLGIYDEVEAKKLMGTKRQIFELKDTSFMLDGQKVQFIEADVDYHFNNSICRDSANKHLRIIDVIDTKTGKRIYRGDESQVCYGFDITRFALLNILKKRTLCKGRYRLEIIYDGR